MYFDFDKTEIDFLDFRLDFQGQSVFEKVARRASTLSEKGGRERERPRGAAKGAARQQK